MYEEPVSLKKEILNCLAYLVFGTGSLITLSYFLIKDIDSIPSTSKESPLIEKVENIPQKKLENISPETYVQKNQYTSKGSYKE